MTDSQRARRWRTLVAPNGARVVFPAGTSYNALLDQMLKWAYADLSATGIIVPARSPLQNLVPRRLQRMATRWSVEVRGG